MAGWSATVSRSAAVSRERVWATLLDGPRWSAWNAGVRWIAVDDVLGSGHYITVAPHKGRQTALRILDVDEPERLALLLRFGPLAQLRIGIVLTEDAACTVTVEFQAQGVAAGLLVRRLAAPLAVRTGDDLERLLDLALSDARTAEAR